MADADLASTLAGIKERAEQAAPALAARRGLNSMADSAEDVPSLLAAVDAVLELADRFDTIPAYGPTPATRHHVARSFRAAIIRGLTGKEAGDE